MENMYVGSDFDDLLTQDRILDEADTVAIKRVITHQIVTEMERAAITRAELARRMKTSRSAVERLLDPTNSSVTLTTLERAAAAVGKRLQVRLAEDLEDLQAIEDRAGEPVISYEDFAASLRDTGKP